MDLLAQFFGTYANGAAMYIGLKYDATTSYAWEDGTTYDYNWVGALFADAYVGTYTY